MAAAALQLALALGGSLAPTAPPPPSPPPLPDDEAGTTAAATAIRYGKYWASCQGPSPPRTCQNGADVDRTPNTLWYYAPPHVDPSRKPPLLVQIHGGGFVSGFPYTTCRKECMAALANGMAYASFGYRLVGQTHYFGDGLAHKQEEELVLVDRAGALSLAQDGRKMSDYKVWSRAFVSARQVCACAKR